MPHNAKVSRLNPVGRRGGSVGLSSSLTVAPKGARTTTDALGRKKKKSRVGNTRKKELGFIQDTLDIQFGQDEDDLRQQNINLLRRQGTGRSTTQSGATIGQFNPQTFASSPFALQDNQSIINPEFDFASIGITNIQEQLNSLTPQNKIITNIVDAINATQAQGIKARNKRIQARKKLIGSQITGRQSTRNSRDRLRLFNLLEEESNNVL